MPPDNRNTTAGNGGESESIKAAGLNLSVDAGTDSGREARRAESDLSFEDRDAAWWSGVEYGMAERFRLDVSEAVQAALADQALAALGMARRSAIHGAADLVGYGWGRFGPERPRSAELYALSAFVSPT